MEWKNGCTIGEGHGKDLWRRFWTLIDILIMGIFMAGGTIRGKC
jgi:hypothetical protein